MAGSVNKVILVGNLGGDPEVRYTPSGDAVANFNVATSESWTKQDGTREEKTEWHRVVCWKKLADLAGQYLAKGRQVFIEGRLQTREYEKDGVKRFITEIKAMDIQFLDKAPEKQEQPAQQSKPSPKPAPKQAPDVGGPDYAARDDDQIPF